MVTTIDIEAMPTGLRVDGEGTLRVGSSRVTFELVIGAYEEGETAEGIAERYPSLELPALYAALSWYLRNRADATRYLEARSTLAEEVRAEAESRYPTAEFRERLRARWAARSADLART